MEMKKTTKRMLWATGGMVILSAVLLTESYSKRLSEG